MKTNTEMHMLFRPAIYMSIKLCHETGLFPSSLHLTGVDIPNKIEDYDSGSVGRVYVGMWDRQPIVAKCIKTNRRERESAKKVR
jgi:hypothetical protein